MVVVVVTMEKMVLMWRLTVLVLALVLRCDAMRCEQSSAEQRRAEQWAAWSQEGDWIRCACELTCYHDW